LSEAPSHCVRGPRRLRGRLCSVTTAPVQGDGPLREPPMATPSLPESAPITPEHVPPPSPQALHAPFLEILPTIETHAKIYFRHLKCPGRKADAIQETIAVAWKWYLRARGRGKDPAEFVSTLATYAARHVRSGRKLCGQEKARDVLSPRAQQRKGFKVEALACSTRCSFETFYTDPHGQDRMDAFEERLKDNTRSPVPDQAAFRIDHPAWLSQLGTRNRAIARDMAMDYATLELAARHRVSPGRISQLRRELHADHRRFHGEASHP
jgi:hypothetical protein